MENRRSRWRAILSSIDCRIRETKYAEEMMYHPLLRRNNPKTTMITKGLSWLRSSKMYRQHQSIKTAFESNQPAHTPIWYSNRSEHTQLSSRCSPRPTQHRSRLPMPLRRWEMQATQIICQTSRQRCERLILDGKSPKTWPRIRAEKVEIDKI